MPMYDQGGSPPGLYNYLGMIPTDVFAVAINIFPNQYPLLTRLDKGAVGSASFKFSNDNFRPNSVALANGAATGTGTTFVVADASVFDVDDIIQVEAEYMQVVSVNTSTNTLTVVRGVDGTTNATHADTLPVYLVTNARTGAAVDIPQLKRRPVIVEQWIQTVQHAYGIGGQALDTTNFVSAYGGPLSGDKYRCASECFRDFERAMYYGKVQANNAAGAKPTMAGLQSLITTNKVTSPTNASAYKPADFVRDTTQACINHGGQPRYMLLSSDFQTAFNTWASPLIRLESGMSSYGINVDTFYATFMPSISLILAPMLRPGTAVCFDDREAVIRMQRDLTDMPRGRRGDAVEGDMVMRGAIELDNEAHHAWVEGITAFAAP